MNNKLLSLVLAAATIVCVTPIFAEGATHHGPPSTVGSHATGVKGSSEAPPSTFADLITVGQLKVLYPPKRIATLTAGQLKELTPAHFKVLTPAQVGAFTQTQLFLLTPAQVGALSENQLKLLSPEKLRRLKASKDLFKSEVPVQGESGIGVLPQLD